MKITKDEWWATPVWYFDIPISDVDPNKIEKECYLIKQSSNSRSISNVGGFQSDSFLYSKYPNSEIKQLLSVVSKNTATWYSELNIKQSFSGTVDNFWININSTNNYNNPHVHQQSIFSGVYYVKTNDNTGKIVFNNNSNIDYICQSFTEGSRYSFSSIKYNTPIGRVIVFPSWIQHHVESNQSSQDRISIAFNMS